MVLETIAPDAPSNEEAFRAYIATKENPSEFLTAVVHPTTQAFWDFDAMGLTVESANIGRAKFVKEQIEIEADEKEQEKNQQQDAFAEFIAIMQGVLNPEDYELHDWNINGQQYQVSKAGIEATLDRIRNDLDGMAEEYGLSDDQKQKLDDLEKEMRGKTPEEQQAILDRFAKDNPEVVEAFMKEQEKQATGLKRELDSKLALDNEVENQNEQQLSMSGPQETYSEDSFFDDLGGMESEIAAEFNPNAFGDSPAPMEQVAPVTKKLEIGLG